MIKVLLDATLADLGKEHDMTCFMALSDWGSTRGEADFGRVDLCEMKAAILRSALSGTSATDRLTGKKSGIALV